MARAAAVSTEELLRVLTRWRKQGKLRRIGAVVNHLRVGLGAGALVLWPVPPRRIRQVGRTLAAFEQVSHAYQRKTADDWPYSVYTMVHGASFEQLQQTIEQMSRACGIAQYRVLITLKEFKKTSAIYISQP
jgi:DNA-binding Lrp family transcriptional regulator